MRAPSVRPRRPDRHTVVLGAVVIAAFALRVVALRHGLPHVYNPDEEQHFVPHATQAADGDWHPHYFENPSALTYLLAVVLRVAFAGEDRTRLLDSDPAAVFTLTRVVVAVLGTVLVVLVAWAGRRYYDRTVGVLAAAIIGFGFLPVYYSHQVLNDVPTLLPLTVALVACLWIYERGGAAAYLLAGAAVGVAAATKYLAAPMAVVVALAVVLRLTRGRERPARAVLLLAAAGIACLAALLALNPFIVLDFDLFVSQFNGQSAQAASGKLGQHGSAWWYYPLSLLWGFGLVPLLLAVVGGVLAFREDRCRALLLLAFPVLLYAYMATQERFFGRWMLPMYPALAILAAVGVVRVGAWLRQRRPSAGPGARLVVPLLGVIVLAQPAFDAVRSDLVLSRTDTRTQAEQWIRGNVEDRRIVLEPAVPSDYLDGDPAFDTFPVRRPHQDYEESLQPGLVDTYRQRGYCWVMVNSHQRDRGLAAGLTDAHAYYRRLERESRVEASFSPYRDGAGPSPFSYDFSFNWYPLAYERPGPTVEVRRLTDCTPAED